MSSGFSNIKIRPSDSWVDGVVYYFQVPAGIADLLGNRTEAPIELVFSTGPELSATRVTGEVRARVGGQAVSPGRVLFFNLAGDSIPYSALTDRQGEFELRYLPPDDYWSFGFQDLNNNLSLERLFEPYDSVRLDLESEGSATLAFRIVEPDTTPPVLGLIRSQDDLVLELQFDDYLEPEQDLAISGMVLRQVESGARWEIEEVRVEPGERPRGRQRSGGPGRTETTRDTAGVEPNPPDSTTAEEGQAPSPGAAAPEADSTAAGEAVVGIPEADSATIGAAAPGLIQEGPPAQPDDSLAEEVLPSQSLRIQLATPLEQGTYRLTLDRVVNLRLLETRVDTTFSYPLAAEEPGTQQDGGEPDPGVPPDQDPAREGQGREDGGEGVGR